MKINKGKKKQDNVFNKIITHASRDPSIFGRPKLHKEGIPLRLILSSFNSVLSNASTYIVPTLKGR